MAEAGAGGKKRGGQRASSRPSLSLAFVSGILRYRPGHGARKSLQQQLKGSSRYQQCCKVRVDHNSSGHARGWAWISFKSPEDRDRCCQEMNAQLSLPVKDSLGRYPVTITPCTNTKLCQAFPSASHEQREQLQLDPEGFYSITDEYTADEITKASLVILAVIQESMPIAVDCTGGCGGNTASLIRSNAFRKVVSYEQHEARAHCLDHNMFVLFPGEDHVWTIRRENFLSSLNNLDAAVLGQPPPGVSPIDFMFLDPPWGGQNYRHQVAGDPSPSSKEPAAPSDYILGDVSSQSMQLSHLLSEIIPFHLNSSTNEGPPTVNSVKLVGVKLPDIFDLSALCERITRSDSRWEQEDASGNILTSPSPNPTNNSTKPKEFILDSRPHPFRLQLGIRTVLLLVAYPPFFRNLHLDCIVEKLAQFDRDRGMEFHPRFYDWEKKKWISLHTWKGCKMVPVTIGEGVTV